MKMNFIKFFILLALSNIIVSCTSSSKKNDHNPIKQFKEVNLDNGVNVLFVPDSKLPYLSLTWSSLYGSAHDPKNLAGLTQATMQLLTKGTQTRSATRLNEEIEVLGASLNSFAGKESSILELEGLSWHEDKLLDLFSDILLNPRFTLEELNRYRKVTEARIMSVADMPSTLASEVFEKELYKNTSYEHREDGTIQSLKNITLKNLSEQFTLMMNPKKVSLTVVGKYSPEFEEKLKKKFSRLNVKKESDDIRIQIPKLTGKSILVIDKPDAAQAEIRIGHYGIMRNSPDFQKVMLANTALGQGFSSRLVDRIRDQLGLTYSISSQFDFRKNVGPFVIRTFTQNERVGQTLEETLKVYSEFQSQGITDKEFQLARNYLIGRFPLLLETPEKLAFNLRVLRFFGISDEYLINYRENLKKLKLSEVNEAIQKNFDSQNLQIVILGQKSKIQEQLKLDAKIEYKNFKDMVN